MSNLKIGLYRHFKGGYVNVVDFVEGYVICIDLTIGVKYLVNKDNFYTNPPENAENLTGQKYMYEPVKDFNNQLNMITTDNLVKELIKRDDNPLSGFDIEGYKDKKVWCTEYVVGYIQIAENGITGEQFEKFTPMSMVYTTLEEAREKRIKINNKLAVIMKRVFLKIED